MIGAFTNRVVCSPRFPRFSSFPWFPWSQRKRDDNKNKICVFPGGWAGGQERKIVQNAIFRGKRHDNKILKVKILLSRNFVVMAQAPMVSANPALNSLFVAV